jgi:exonuclease SbcC
MRIKKLITSNTKGQNINEELGGRDIYLGPNGSGKTTRLESLMGGILGYVPHRGKSLDSLFSMCSGDQMNITLETESLTWTRTIEEKSTKKKSTGEKVFSLSSTTSIFPPRTEKTEDERRDRISNEVGNFSLMFDLSEFLGMSEEKQRSFIFALSPIDAKWTKDAVLNALTNPTSALKIQLTQIWSDNQSIHDNIAIMLNWCKEQLKELKKKLKDSSATKETLLKQKQEIGDPKSTTELREEITKAREQLLDIEKQIAAGRERNNERMRILNEISKLQSEPKESIGIVPDINELIKTSDTLQQMLTKAKEEVIGTQSELDSKRNKYASMAQEFAALEAKLSSIESQKQTTKSFKNICPVTKKHCKVDFSEIIAEWDEEIKQLKLAVKKSKSQLEIMAKEGTSISVVLRDKQKAVEQGQSLLIAAERAIGEGELIKHKHEVQIEYQKKAEERVDELNRRIAQLDIPDISLLEKTRYGIQERIPALELEIKKQDEILTVRKSFEKAKIAEIETQEEVEAFDRACHDLGPNRLQGEVLSGSLGSLVDKANQLLAGVSKSFNLRIELQDKNDKPCFKMFWQKSEDVRIPFESLSGGEKIIFSVALISALVILKNPPVKAICIEASEVDTHNLSTLLEAINQMGTEIDNFVVATHVSPSEMITNWTIHKLEKS